MKKLDKFLMDHPEYTAIITLGMIVLFIAASVIRRLV